MSNAVRRAAKVLRHYGQRGDTVLAHINPAEAKFLKEKFGGDKNPQTGLPQYGLFKSVGKVFKGAEKIIRKPVKAIAPIAGAIAGNMLMPGIGGPLGGAMAGGITGGKKGAIKGGLMGGMLGAFGPYAGNFLGVSPQGFAGRAMGMGNPGLLGQLGLGGKGAGLMGGSGMMGGIPGLDAAAAEKGLSSGDLMKYGLMGLTAYGALKGKSDYKDYKGPTVQEQLAQHGIKKTPIVPYQEPKAPARNQRVLQHPELFKPEMMEELYFEPTPFPSGYAHGGPVVKEGCLYGASGGQTDDVDASMPEGSYVMDATTISLYGDGNTENGFHKLNELKDKFIKAAHEHGYERPHNLKMLPAKVSHGEDIWPPEAVFGAGILVDDNPKHGVKVLDRFRDNLREQKGVKKFLPPKSKDASYYLE